MTGSVDMKLVLMAEQQIIGYAHASQGYSLTMLIASMGLKRNEWDVISSNDGIHLPKDVIDEIEAYFSS